MMPTEICSVMVIILTAGQRQPASESDTGNGLAATYTYDASGIRTSKTVNGVTTEYLTAGGSVLSEKKNGMAALPV